MHLAAKIAFGAAIGAAVGLLLGRARICSGGACKAPGRLVFSIIACAFFGACVAWAMASR